MRSGAILLEPLLLDIGIDGLELLPEGLQATARTDRSSQTDRSTCRIDSTERAVGVGGLKTNEAYHSKADDGKSGVPVGRGF